MRIVLVPYGCGHHGWRAPDRPDTTWGWFRTAVCMDCTPNPEPWNRESTATAWVFRVLT